MASGSFYIPRTSGSTFLTFRVDWSSTSNGSAKNSSDINVKVTVIKSSSSTARTYGSADTTVSVDGSSKSNNGLSFSVSPGTSVQLFNWTFTDVEHGSDGSKIVPISVTVGGNVMGASGSSNVTLDKIPRQATLTAADNFTDEENPTVTFTNPAGDAVEYLGVCISSDGYSIEVPYKEITDKASTSYTFDLQPEEIEALWNVTLSGSNSRNVYFYIKTMIDGVEYLDKLQRTFKVVNCEPTLDPTVIDTNTRANVLTGDNPNKIIKGFNTIYVASGAAALKGASIIKQSIICGNTELSTGNGTFTNADSASFIFSATDNRGNTVTQIISKELVDYTKLTCDLKIGAPDADGDLEFYITGNFFEGNFGAANNVLAVEYRYARNNESYPTNDNGEEIWIHADAVVTDNKYVATINMDGLDYQSSYIFQARAADQIYYEYIKTTNYRVKTTPVYDWSDVDFNFNVPVHASNGISYEPAHIAEGDCDYLLTAGHYFLESEVLNRPDTIYPGWIDVQSYGGGYNCRQIYTSINDEKFERIKWDTENNWGAWVNVVEVIAHGTETTPDDITWTYEKRSNGVAECWGKRNFGSVPCTKPFGSLYETEALTATLPNIFSENPTYIGIEVLYGGACGWISKGNETPSPTSTGKFYIERPTSATYTNLTLGFHIIGKWK